MMTRTEGRFPGHNHDELFFQTWTTPDADATLVVTHGLSEHSESYHLRFAPAMLERGWNLMSWDLRGHGRSPGARGYIDRFQSFAKDLEAFLHFLFEQGKLDKPYVLLGHSMGGLVTLRFLVDYAFPSSQHKPGAVVLSAPLLGITVPVPAYKDWGARVLARLAPQVTMKNDILYENLSRDVEILESYPKDPLRHEKVSPPLYLGMIESMAYVKGHSSHLTLPTILQVAGIDHVVSTPSAIEFFKQLPNPQNKLFEYPESRHEIYNDLDNEKAFNDLDQSLRDTLQLSTRPLGQGQSSAKHPRSSQA